MNEETSSAKVMSTSERSRVKAILIDVVLVFLGLALGIAGAYYFERSHDEDTNTETTGSTESESVTYKDASWPFSFEYPGYVKLSVDNKSDNESGSVNFLASKPAVVIKSSKDATKLSEYLYLDQKSSGTAKLGQEDAVIFKFPGGYCDGPGCSDSFVTYSARHGEKIYNVSFFGNDSIEPEEQKVLDTFEFVD